MASQDKAGRDPTRCENKRPMALLSPLVKLLELGLVRRMLPMLEGGIPERMPAEGRYAYQKGRSTEILLADLDAFAEGNVKDGFSTYVVGLDIDGAFDSASLPGLVETL